MYRIGFSKDIHKFIVKKSPQRKLVIGGVTISPKHEAVAISDGDALIHAIFESLLGALALGDIAKYYPEATTPDNFDSTKMLEEMNNILASQKYEIVNLDCLIVLDEIKISPFYKKIINNLAKHLKINKKNISIKATKSEGLALNYFEANAIILIKAI